MQGGRENTRSRLRVLSEKTVMTAKKYLQQYKLLDCRISAKCEQLERLRELSTKVSPSSGNGAPGGVSDRVGAIVAKICDVEEEINKMIDELIDLKSEIERTIAAVPDETYRTLLELRYINGKTFEQIADEMYYTYKWVCVLHGRALVAVKEYIEIHNQSVV